MSDVWLVIGGLAVATAGLKAASVLVASGRRPDRALLAVIEALAPALLGALIVAETVAGKNGGISPDARLVGLAAAVAALAVTRSLILVVTAAAIAAAAARAVG